MNNLSKLEWIHFAIQEAMNGNTGELDQALAFVEDLREEVPVYYQPDLSEQWDVIGGDAPIPSFGVYKSRENAQKAHPNATIIMYSGYDIENPTYMESEQDD